MLLAVAVVWHPPTLTPTPIPTPTTVRLHERCASVRIVSAALEEAKEFFMFSCQVQVKSSHVYRRIVSHCRHASWRRTGIEWGRPAKGTQRRRRWGERWVLNVILHFVTSWLIWLESYLFLLCWVQRNFSCTLLARAFYMAFAEGSATPISV